LHCHCLRLIELYKHWIDVNKLRFSDYGTFAMQKWSLKQTIMEDTNPYVGMWVTADGSIRQELLPNNRYDEARGKRQSAYTGRYQITGNYIYYWDDTGFEADGKFVDINTLNHAGMIFYREK